jgi:hypothetical protein
VLHTRHLRLSAPVDPDIQDCCQLNEPLNYPSACWQRTARIVSASSGLPYPQDRFTDIKTPGHYSVSERTEIVTKYSVPRFSMQISLRMSWGKKTNSLAFTPQTNYKARCATAGWRSYSELLRDEWFCMFTATIPDCRSLDFSCNCHLSYPHEGERNSFHTNYVTENL